MKIGFILAAGFGKRMGDLTQRTPKPLLPVNDVPLIYYALFQLHRFGARACVINTHYLADQIEAELRGFPFFELLFSREQPEILGTAGGLRHAMPRLDLAAQKARTNESALLLLNPDTIFFPDAADTPRDDWLTNAESCLALKPKAAGSREVGWNLEDDGTLRHAADGTHFYIGFSVVDWRCVKHLPDHTYDELGPLWKTMATGGKLRGHVFQGKVVDAGTRAAYDSLKGKEIVPPHMQAEWSEFLGRL